MRWVALVPVRTVVNKSVRVYPGQARRMGAKATGVLPGIEKCSEIKCGEPRKSASLASGEVARDAGCRRALVAQSRPAKPKRMRT